MQHRLLSRVLLASIVAAFGLAAVPFFSTASATAPSGKILVLDSGGAEAVGGFNAAGILACPGSSLCYVLVSPSTFSSMSFAGYSSIHVPWAPSGAAINALHARAADLDSFVWNGGGLTAYSMYNQDWSWVPAGSTITQTAYHAEDVHLLPAGLAHPAYAGSSDASLSHWGNSRHNVFTGGMPSYLVEMTDSYSGPIGYAGQYGHGCVFITGQDPDFHAYYSGSAGAKQLIQTSEGWATSCSTTISVPTPELGSLALVGAGLVGIAGLVVVRRSA